MNISVFNFQHYRDFIVAYLKLQKARSGIRTQLAQAMSCQLSYISHVINGLSHFSLEQSYSFCEFLGFNDDETEFFLLLVQRDKSGTKKLKEYFDVKINKIIKERKEVKKHVGPSTKLDESKQIYYYSSWQIAAIHIALTVPELRTKESLANYFQIPLKRISEILEFLCLSGLAKFEKGEYVTGLTKIHLDKNSPHIIKHHTHWRHQSIMALENETSDELHYSAAITIARDDIPLLKKLMLDSIGEHMKLIHPSKEEEVCCYCLDLFKLKKAL